ncbi:MAG: hypothetical protein JWO31_4047 [Phycisphaerales bacterium]|nr:hypothetical protein [Phycisphaerales bacterium]
MLFVEAGIRPLAHKFHDPVRLWDDTADAWFRGWAQRGDVALMSAEVELAAWDADGRKLRVTFVGPRWGSRVERGPAGAGRTEDAREPAVMTCSGRPYNTPTLQGRLG